MEPGDFILVPVDLRLQAVDVRLDLRWRCLLHAPPARVPHPRHPCAREPIALDALRKRRRVPLPVRRLAARARAVALIRAAGERASTPAAGVGRSRNAHYRSTTWARRGTRT